MSVDSDSYVDNLRAELRQSVDNTKAILEALDSSLSSVVSCVCYVNASRIPVEIASVQETYSSLQKALHDLLFTVDSDDDDDDRSDHYDSGEDESSSALDTARIFAVCLCAKHLVGIATVCG